MSVREIAGATLFALPFVVMLAIMLQHHGWKETAAIWALVGVVAGCFMLGAWLLSGGAK